MNVQRTDFIVDPVGWTSAEYARQWRVGRVAWLLETSPRNLARLSAVRLVPVGRGTSVEVRVVANG